MDKLNELLVTSVPGLLIVTIFVIVDKIIVPLWKGRASTINRRIENLEHEQQHLRNEISRANEGIATATGTLTAVQELLKKK